MALLHTRGLLLVMLMFAAAISNQTNAADSFELTEDGWHSWQVPSVRYAENETIYVLVRSGETREIEVAGDWCWGRSQRNRRQNPVDHGVLTVDESIDWLQQYLGTHSDLSSDALAAISRHDGERALQILIDIVESDADIDRREEAVFWMAMSESEEAFAYIDRLLMAD